MVKLQFDQNKQFKITLPKQLAMAKGWKKGDKILFELNEKGEIVIRKGHESNAIMDESQGQNNEIRN
jgi:bifunctional DNA-binding transcriptional regulator/antitoxin component of YhaV-PrlF toxin-antitoxin module